MEHDGDRLFPGLLILAVRQGRTVHAEDMARTHRRIGYVDMRVAGGKDSGNKKNRKNPARFPEIVLFHLFPYFIGSFTPRTTPVRNRSAPFIITSLFTCQ